MYGKLAMYAKLLPRKYESQTMYEKLLLPLTSSKSMGNRIHFCMGNDNSYNSKLTSMQSSMALAGVQ